MNNKYNFKRIRKNKKILEIVFRMIFQDKFNLVLINNNF